MIKCIFSLKTLCYIFMVNSAPFVGAPCLKTNLAYLFSPPCIYLKAVTDSGK